MKRIKANNLFQAAITYDTFHKKEQSGELNKELQERIEKKTAEVMAMIDKDAIMAKVDALLADFVKDVKEV